MERGHRIRLDRVEHLGAARHAAGVPVLELPPGDQHERIGAVGLLGGGDHLRRDELAPAGRRRERLGEHDARSGIAFLLARIGDRVLALEPLPRDAGDRRHRLPHLGEHLARMRVAPVEAEPLAISTMIDRSCRASPGGVSACRPSCTRRSVLVNVPVFSGKRRRRQDDVGEIRGLGEEDVLHHQHLERRQRLPRVRDVGVRHRRVLAHDVHAADLARVHGVHDLDDGEPRLRVERHAPQRLEPSRAPPLSTRR